MFPIAFLTKFFSTGGQPEINLANVSWLFLSSSLLIFNRQRLAAMWMILPFLEQRWPTAHPRCKTTSSGVKSEARCWRSHLVEPRVVLVSSRMIRQRALLTPFGISFLGDHPTCVLLEALFLMGKYAETLFHSTGGNLSYCYYAQGWSWHWRWRICPWVI